jgi:alginate O-acetyltransferase complex protein AlgI
VDFKSLIFLGFVFFAVFSYRVTSLPLYRSTLLLGLNLLYLTCFAQYYYQLMPLFILLSLGYLLLYLVQSKVDTEPIGMWGILAIIILFIYLKQYDFIKFIPFFPFPVIVIGLSFIVFRIIHLIVDVSSGEIKEQISPITFFNYTCFFLTFSSGPIQLYKDFSRSYYAPINSFNKREVMQNISRILTGYVKVIIVATFFFKIHEVCLGTIRFSQENIILLYCLATVSFAFFLYYNFVGYMDIVISLGRLIGFDLPENFNNPFGSTSFQEFWSRWHITLSIWFKMYLFNPLLKTLIYKYPDPIISPYLAVVSFLVTFLIMGIWHGSTQAFTIFGVFIGLGVSLNKLYQIKMGKKFGKVLYSKISNNWFYICLSKGFTFSYFCTALICLWMNIEILNKLNQQIGFFGVVYVFCGISFISTIYYILTFFLKPFIDSIYLIFRSLQSYYGIDIFWNLNKLFIITLVIANQKIPAPGFVYEYF